MKNILKNYKTRIISIGILLSIMFSVGIISYNSSKENISKNKAKLETASLGKSLRDEPTEESDVELDATEKSIEIEEEVQQENITDNVENSADSKETSNVSNISTESIEGEYYKVKKGDTLSLIAQRANISTKQLKQLNNLSSDMIYVNQTLKIKGTVNNSSSQTPNKGTVNNSSSQTPNRGNERNEDLYWLSRIIHAEAQGESYKGKVAVGNVIINRVNSSKFPNTIKGVIFDKQDGYTQFSPVIDGSIYNTPDAESIKAATAVLNGERPVGNALYFLNPSKSTNFWIVNNRQYMTTIGLHDFYY